MSSDSVGFLLFVFFWGWGGEQWVPRYSLTSWYAAQGKDCRLGSLGLFWPVGYLRTILFSSIAVSTGVCRSDLCSKKSEFFWSCRPGFRARSWWFGAPGMGCAFWGCWSNFDGVYGKSYLGFLGPVWPPIRLSGLWALEWSPGKGCDLGYWTGLRS